VPGADRLAALQGKVAGAQIIAADSIGVARRPADSIPALQLRQPRIEQRSAEVAGVNVAEGGVITGQVVDERGDGIGMASVSVVGMPLGAVTDDSGRFEIPGVRPGTYAVEARRIGYQFSRVDDLQVAAGDTSVATLGMTTTALQLNSVVVGGAADPVARAKLPFAAARIVADPAECYVITFDAPANLRASGQREQREARIRLEPAFANAERQLAGGAAATAGGRGGAVGRGGAARAAAPPVVPATPPAAGYLADGRVLFSATWQRIVGDSILVRWFDGTQALAMRAELRGETLRGNVVAGAEVDPARTSGATGRRIACGSQ
jgi:hypothetical protein